MIRTVGGINKVGSDKPTVANEPRRRDQEGHGGLLVDADTQEIGPIPITFQN